MKITFFIGGLSGGGSERVVCNLGNYLCSQGNTIDIITMSDEDPSYEVNTNIRRYILLHKQERRNLVRNMLLRYNRLKQYIKVSNTQGYIVMLPLTIIFLLSLHRHIKVPVIVAERADPKNLPFWKWFLIRYLCKYASGFVFQTKDAQSCYAPYIKDKPSIVIPNAINPAFIREINFKNKKKQIVAVGRFTKQKNFMLLLRAFMSIHKKFQDYQLTIYGQGEQRAFLERFIQKHNLQTVVSLPGYVKDIERRLSEASIFVLSSNYEGMPNVLMEAMASGLACISTDCPCGGPRFLIENEKNGLLVPTGDKTLLAHALYRVLSEPRLCKKLGHQAIHIQQRFSPQVIYAQWIDFINSQITQDIYAQ